MNSVILSMLSRYDCKTAKDYENALKEIIQEVALLGLWRAKFFEHAAFYGGTALRILYGLDRFSEDLDFSLLKPQENFNLAPYLSSIRTELAAMGFSATVDKKEKSIDASIESAFIKAGTKEHSLRINVPGGMVDRIQNNMLMSIKIELDTDPPPGFQTEAKVILQPIPFSVNTYKQSDLFAGKLHAILQRKWKNRVKGRDYYDFVWYVARKIPVNVSHLEQRLIQSGGWTSDQQLTLSTLTKLLQARFAAVDFDLAKKDVQPFLSDPDAIEIWSRDFFESLLPQLVAS